MDFNPNQAVNVKKVQALDAWLKTSNIKITQINGQRKFGGPPEVWDGPTPGAHCEVYISQIPRDAYEDSLIPLFRSVGPLWEFRLMMNFSGQNRGFAYAKYGTVAQATRAIRLLNNYMLEPGCCLSVRRSIEKRHIRIGDLPPTTRQEDLLQVLRVLAEGVEGVSLKTGPGIEGMSAIVAFSSHNTASMAKKILKEELKKQFSLDVSIKWQSVERPNPDELCHLQKAPKCLPPPGLKPPPVQLPFSPYFPGFCRAVGAPTAPLHPDPTYPSSLYHFKNAN